MFRRAFGRNPFCVARKKDLTYRCGHLCPRRSCSVCPSIGSMLECRETPPLPPACHSFLSCALFLPLVGNHTTTPCFFPSSPREGWSDGAYAAASATHATQPLLSPLLSSPLISCPRRHPPLLPRIMPCSAAAPKLGSGGRNGAPGAASEMGEIYN